MPEQFLHGVEVVEIDGGSRPIRTVKSSVIGLVGTAPLAAAAVAASLSVGAVGTKDALAFTAQNAGVVGNVVSVAYVDPQANDAVLSVIVTGNAIVVNLATGAGGEITSTAGEVKTALETKPDSAALIGIAHTGASDGSGVLAAMSATLLAGGVDEPFPLDTPVLVAGSRVEAAKLGSTGTLVDAIDGVFDQVGAMVVVIRVADDVDPAVVKSNVIGGVNGNGNYQGLQALLGAESIAKVEPKILIAPGFSDDLAVATEMATIADRLRACFIIDGPDTTDADAISYRENFGSKRGYLVDPKMKVWDTMLNAEKLVPGSAHVAGVIAKSDNERGFWWSPSNREVRGIVGTSRPVDFKLGDPNCRANYLNENEVTTFIQQDGYRIWGNRTLTNDPKWAFLSVVRTADIIHDSLQRAHMWAVDRNLTATYFEDVVEGVNNYLRHLTNIGAILGGECWADADLNSPDQLQAGKAYFDFDFTPPGPAEHITFRSHLVNDYYTEVLSNG